MICFRNVSEIGPLSIRQLAWVTVSDLEPKLNAATAATAPA